MARPLVVSVLLIAVSRPVSAQIPVIDPGNLAQAILIADRTLREYNTLWAQYQTLLRMSQRLPGMDGYRLPSVPTAAHDAARWTYARHWLEALNVGDPTGTAYGDTTRRLDAPGTSLQSLPPDARRAIENAYSTVDIADALGQAGGQQVGVSRAYSAQLQRAIDALAGDVLSPSPEQHELTAILDKVAASALIGRREDMAANQLLAGALEQLLVRSKRLRDTEAATMNMRLGGLRDGRAAGGSVVRGAADDLRTWRQP
jgi:hypothetical protein